MTLPSLAAEHDIGATPAKFISGVVVSINFQSVIHLFFLFILPTSIHLSLQTTSFSSGTRIGRLLRIICVRFHIDQPSFAMLQFVWLFLCSWTLRIHAVSRAEAWSLARSDPLFPEWDRLHTSLLAQPIFHQGIAILRDHLILQPSFSTPVGKPRGLNDDAFGSCSPDIVANPIGCVDQVRRAILSDQSAPDPPHLYEDESLLASIDFIAMHSPDYVRACRTRSITAIAKVGAMFRSLDTAFVYPFMPATVAKVAGSNHIALMHAMGIVLDFPDATLALSYMTGFAPTGDLCLSGVHRLGEQWEAYKQSLPHAGPAFFQYAVNWNRRLTRSVARWGLRADCQSTSLSQDQTDQCETWNKSLAEEVDGWSERVTLQQLRASCPGGFVLLRRFPVRRFPGDSVRPCDDGTGCGINNMFSSMEHIVCENADWPCRAARLFYERGIKSVKGGTDDMRKAYRQMPTSDTCFTSVAIWNPNQGEVAFFRLFGFPFGLTTAVSQFNRMPTFIQEACRCWGAVPCCHYFDDFAVCDQAETASGAQFFLRRICELCGPRLEISKHVSSRFMFDFLGITTDLTLLHMGIIKMRIKESRRQKLILALSSIYAAKSVLYTEAQSLAGKLFFATLTVYNRVGRGPIRAFRTCADAQRLRKRSMARSTWSPALDAAVLFFLAFLAANPVKIIRLAQSPRRPLLAWSDAMWQDGMGRIGWLVYDPEDGVYLYSSSWIPKWVTSFWIAKESMIGQAEILAAMVIYTSLHPDRLLNRRVVHHVDNVSAIAALCKGYSPKADSNMLVTLFHLISSKLQFISWWTHVYSEDLVADGPSRGYFDTVCSLGARWCPTTYPTLNDFTKPLQDWFVPSVAPRARAYPRAHRKRNR